MGSRPLIAMHSQESASPLILQFSLQPISMLTPKKNAAHYAKKIFSQSLKKTKALGKYYRTATDWIKPTVDKAVDPIAIFAGANMALSIVIYYTNAEMIYPVLFWISDGKLYGLIDRHVWIEFIIKSIIYVSIYGLANLAIIFPMVVKSFKKRSRPSWANHVKTWLIISIGIIAWNGGGVRQDYNQIKWRIQMTNGFFDTIGAVLNPTNFRTIDRYMSGLKSSQMTRQAWGLFGSRSSKAIAKEIERECRRIRQRNVKTPSKIAKDATSLINQGLIDNPAQLIYITRVIYFEGAFDPKARNLADIKRGLAGIASVIYNRYIFDKANEKAGRQRVFSNRGANLYDIVFHCTPNQYGSITWQFSAVSKNASYFNGNRPLSLSSGKINADRILLCYEILMDVLTGKRGDNTKAALFYQNPSCVDRHNRNWNARGLEDVTRINSHVFFRPKRLSENWRHRIGA